MSHARLLLLDLVDLPSLPIDRATQVREAGRGQRTSPHLR